MPPHGDRLVVGGELLPNPEHGDRPGLAGNRLLFPRPGHLGLGSGQDLLVLAQVGQVDGGESVVEGGNGRTGTIRTAAHELSPRAWSGVDGVTALSAPLVS